MSDGITHSPSPTTTHSVAPRDEVTCPGPGQCHGCASWCDVCGSVNVVCHADDRCDRHRCARCNMRLTPEEVTDREDWHTQCRGCEIQHMVELNERAMLSCAALGDEQGVTLHAAAIKYLLE